MENYHKYKHYKKLYKNLKGGTSSPEESAKSKFKNIISNTNTDEFDKAKEIYYYNLDSLESNILLHLKKVAFSSIQITPDLLMENPSIINNDIKLTIKYLQKKALSLGAREGAVMH